MKSELGKGRRSYPWDAEIVAQVLVSGQNLRGSLI